MCLTKDDNLWQGRNDKGGPHMAGLETISVSKLGLCLRCGEGARRRYIEGDKIPPNVARARGTGLHEASRVNLRQKIESHVDLPLSDLKDAARDGYIKSFEGGIYLTREQAGQKTQLINDGLNETLRCTERYTESIAPLYQPVSVETPFAIDVGLPVILNGIMDIQEEPRVGDLKTASMKWPAARINEEISVPFYSYAHETIHKQRPLFRFDIIVSRKDSTEHQVQEKICTKKDYLAMFTKIQAVIKMFKLGMFPPAYPGAWWCQEKFCGYYSSCPYVGNPLPKRWV